MKRVASSSSLSMTNSFSGIGSVYGNIWKAVTTLANDPYPEVANMAQSLVNEVKKRLRHSESSRHHEPSMSEPSSPSLHPTFTMSESPPAGHHSSSGRHHRTDSDSSGGHTRPSSSNANTSHSVYARSRKRTIFGREPSITEEASAEDLSQTSRSPLISTKFVDWCAKHFCDSSTVAKYSEGDTESERHKQREWRIIRNLAIKRSAREELKRADASRLDERIFQQRNSAMPLKIALHPYEPQLFVAEKDSFSVWRWDGQPGIPSLLGTQSNINSHGARTTAMQIVNPHDTSLLMFGSDDGAVKIWSSYSDDRPQPKLVTAFQMFSDMQPSSKSCGLILFWDQEARQLAAGGDPKVVRLWDACREMRVQDIHTGCDTGVTSLAGDGEHLICAGCKDGSVRVFDKRLNDARIYTFRDHESSIVCAHIFPDQEKHVSVLSGSSNGEVRFWDKRVCSSVKYMQISQSMTTMAVHADADVFAW